jgi:2-methylcitrate dehydratase
MKDVITAIVLAYEFEQRLCEFAPPVYVKENASFNITQLFLLLLQENYRFNNRSDGYAIGINGSHNHTIGCPRRKAYYDENTVDPMAVQSGVFAALMAKKGYTGTEAVFEGKEGFMDVFLGWDVSSQSIKDISVNNHNLSWDIEKLIGNLGTNYKILECSMKAFPTEALTHTHITATLKVMLKNN